MARIAVIRFPGSNCETETLAAITRWLERLAARGDRLQRPDHRLVHRPALRLRDRIGVHELGGEAPDPERDARTPGGAGRVAQGELETAATEVGAQRRRRIEDDRVAYGGENQLRLSAAADDFHGDAAFGFDPIEKHVRVVGGAQGTRAHGPDLPGVGGGRDESETVDDLGRLVENGVGDDAVVLGDRPGEVEHFLFGGDGDEGAVGPDLRDEEVERVGSEVERGDAHNPIVGPVHSRTSPLSPLLWRG